MAMQGRAAVRLTEKLVKTSLGLPGGIVITGVVWDPATAELSLYLAGEALPLHREGEQIRFVGVEAINGTH